SKIPIEPHLVIAFKHSRPVTVGNLVVTPFRKSHDAKDPHSFLVSGHGVNVGVITDIGYACKQILKYFGKCHAAFLESNYCDDMLANGSYPYYLKQRISSDEGHLSNAQALELFLNYKSTDLQLLILSHLSKNNNTMKLVEDLFTQHAGATKIVVASRYKASELYKVSNQNGGLNALRKAAGIQNRKRKNEQQLSLF
ncbi:MAG: MBL fold metallo-hydrolase, partial [Chitinophagaceae bacterium]